MERSVLREVGGRVAVGSPGACSPLGRETSRRLGSSKIFLGFWSLVISFGCVW